MEVSQLHIKRKREAAIKCGSSYEESGDEYDPRKDADSGSEMETFVPACRKPEKARRTKWNKDEKEAIEKYLIPTVTKYKKPPTKQEVLRAQAIAPELSKRHWKSIKFQAYSTYKQIVKKKTQVTTSLFMKGDKSSR